MSPGTQTGPELTPQQINKLVELPPEQLNKALEELSKAGRSDTWDNLLSLFTSGTYGRLESAQANRLEGNVIWLLTELQEGNEETAQRLIGDLMRGYISGDLRGQLAAISVAIRNRTSADYNEALDYNSRVDELKKLGVPEHVLPSAPAPERGFHKKKAGLAPLPSITAPHEPDERHPKIKRKNTIKDADRIMRRLIGGEESGG